MARWPRVVQGAGVRRPVEMGPDHGLTLERPHETVAHGTVDDVPWVVQAAVTAPGPGAKWWEHGPVGPEVSFFLGPDGSWGGGTMSARRPPGAHVSASIHAVGAHPSTVAWVGVVSDDVERIEVSLEDGDARVVEPREGPPGFDPVFWFFHPAGASGSVVALASDGSELESHPLRDLDVTPESNASSGVNGPSWPSDRPPPGWPPDERAYAPGEGPRWEEDFYLHVLRFPLYVVHPDRWNGYAGLSGAGYRRAGSPDDVSFGYFREPGGGGSGFEVTCRHPVEENERRPLEPTTRPEEVGIWRAGSPVDSEAVNFAARFVDDATRRSFWPPGSLLVRYLGTRPLVVDGARIAAERWSWRDLPAMSRLRFLLPDVEVSMLGWNVDEDELAGYAASLERLALGTPLFRAMTAAEARTSTRFAELHGHPDD